MVYHVTPHEGRWQVKRSSNPRASAVLDDHHAAIREARELAESNNVGTIMVHRSDGTAYRRITVD